MSVSTETANFEEVRKAVDLLNSRAGATDQFMKGITLLLNEKMLKYNWVGFYMIDAESSPPMLVLGYYQGAPSPHTRIPLHEGICGAAASSGNTVVVDDVSRDSRYLSCSIETKSEIVAPVFRHGAVAGELDIYSHLPAAFTQEDRELVEYCAQLVGKRLEGENVQPS